MANNTGNAQYRLTYTDAYDVRQSLPNLEVVPTYGPGALSISGIDVPDAALDSTTYNVAFSDVAAATFLQIQNNTGQEITARIGDLYFDVTLVLGVASMAFAAVEGERFSFEILDDNGGTPGDDIGIHRSTGNVIVTSYNNAGVETGDVSTIRVHVNPPIALPDGGLVSFALPTAPVVGAAVGNASVTLTAAQTGAGVVATAVLGDPT